MTAAMRDTIVTVITVATVILRAFQTGRKLLICGNGGSAADSQHIAAEFVGRFRRERRPLPAIALTADNAVITAIANDYGYQYVFSRQIEGIGCNGDVLLLLSASGRSENVLHAAWAAREALITTVGFTSAGSRLADLCDLSLVIDSGDAATVQEFYMREAHAVCGLVEDAICSEPEPCTDSTSRSSHADTSSPSPGRSA